MLKEFDNTYLEACVDMYHRIFTSAEWSFHWLKKDNVHRYFQDMLTAPKSCSYIYFKNDKPIGACFGSISDYFQTAHYYIKEIFIDISCQKQGVGRKMLEAVEQDLMGKGIHHVTLYTSTDIPAYDFYVKQGYVESPTAAYFMKLL